MAARVLRLTEFGDPILERKSRKVTRAFRESLEYKKLIADMSRTLRSAKGVGLAAPQVGIPLRLALIEVRPTPERSDAAIIPRMVVINPKITEYHGSPKPKWEGCLSFNKAFGRVPRYSSITVEYENEMGVRITKRASGLFAHIFQHEVDHLDGIRFIDRMESAASLVTASEYRKSKTKKAKKAAR